MFVESVCISMCSHVCLSSSLCISVCSFLSFRVVYFCVFMFVLVYPNVYVCICSGVSGSVSSHFTIYQLSSVAITYLLCFWRPMQDWILSLCAVRHKTLLFFPSVQQHAFWFLCLVMINNTIDYLVLLAITFLLVIVFILLISLYVFLISWYWFPYKARRWQNNPNKNKKINVVFPSFSYSHFSLVTTN